MKLEASMFAGFVLIVLTIIIFCSYGQQNLSDNDQVITVESQTINSINFSACDDEYFFRKIENQRGFNIKSNKG